MLGNVYAVADGLKLYLEQSSDTVIQNMFYNRWTHDQYLGNVFVFAPNGVIIACAINAPGSMHDSTIAEWGNMYSKREAVYERTGGRCVVDFAFSKGDYPFLIKSSEDYLTNSESSLQITTAKEATSARPTAEWGMRALQETFPRLKDRFVYEARGERKVMILSTVLLLNLRTRLVGINQILNSYMPHLSVEEDYFLRQDIGTDLVCMPKFKQKGKH